MLEDGYTNITARTSNKGTGYFGATINFAEDLFLPAGDYICSFDVIGTDDTARTNALQLKTRENGTISTYTVIPVSPSGAHGSAKFSLGNDVYVYSVYFQSYRSSVSENPVSHTYSNIMLEKGSTAHPYEKFSGGIPMPNPDYPSEIVSVESINILHTDADGNTLSERTIIPPRPLNAIGNYKDKLNVVDGVWEYNTFEADDIKGAYWSKSTTYPGGYYIGSWAKDKKIPSAISHLQTHFKTAINISNYVVGTCFVDNSLNFRVDESVYPTAQDFTAFINSLDDFKFICRTAETVTEPIDTADLDYLRSLVVIPATDHITVTDQSGRGIPWLSEYIINLREVTA